MKWMAQVKSGQVEVVDVQTQMWRLLDAVERDLTEELWALDEVMK